VNQQPLEHLDSGLRETGRNTRPLHTTHFIGTLSAEYTAIALDDTQHLESDTMSLLKKTVSFDRLALLVLLGMQTATIIYLLRMSATNRMDKEILLARLEAHENAERLSSSAQQPNPALRLVAGSIQNPASVVRAHGEMEKMLASMFGTTAHEDMFMPESPFAQLDRLHVQALRMFENSFDDIQLAGKSMGQRGQMEVLVISPAMDMREFDDCYLVAISLPRATRPELSVTLEGRVLSVSGRQSGRPGAAWQFAKRVQLPGPIDTQAVHATLTNGVLRIVAPKGDETVSENTSAKIM